MAQRIHVGLDVLGMSKSNVHSCEKNEREDCEKIENSHITFELTIYNEVVSQFCNDFVDRILENI